MKPFARPCVHINETLLEMIRINGIIIIKRSVLFRWDSLRVFSPKVNGLELEST